MPNLFKALAPRPPTLRATLDKVAAVIRDVELDRRLKEMVAVVVTDARGCAYCVAELLFLGLSICSRCPSMRCDSVGERNAS